MKKFILISLALVWSIFAFSQNVYKNEVMLTVGKFYSPYRYFKYYNGFESIKFEYSHQFFPNMGVSFVQEYGRMFDENTNSRAFVIPTNFCIYYNMLQNKDLKLRISAGTGLEQIYIKSLYEFYPVERNFYGIPVRIEIGFFYKLNERLNLTLNAVTTYCSLFSNKNSLFPSPYYYNTLFFSSNIGLSYYF